MGKGSTVHVVRRERALLGSSASGLPFCIAKLKALTVLFTPSRVMKQRTHRGRSSGSHRSLPPELETGCWGMKVSAPDHN